MANFPTSVFNPPTRSAGQTIQPGHMNDVQDEIAAIADGYLNAKARLNSSHSTVAALSVSGGSTFAGDVSCTGTIGSSGARVKSLWVGQIEASSGAGGDNVALMMAVGGL